MSTPRGQLSPSSPVPLLSVAHGRLRVTHVTFLVFAYLPGPFLRPVSAERLRGRPWARGSLGHEERQARLPCVLPPAGRGSHVREAAADQDARCSLRQAAWGNLGAGLRDPGQSPAVLCRQTVPLGLPLGLSGDRRLTTGHQV